MKTPRKQTTENYIKEIRRGSSASVKNNHKVLN